MAISPDLFIKSAEAMLSNNPAEIDFRNAASRAYYCGYHLGKYVSDKHGIPPFGTGGVHARLINGLQKSGNKDIEKIGRFLFEAYKFRYNADYVLNSDFVELSARATISKIKGVIYHFEELQKKAAS